MMDPKLFKQIWVIKDGQNKCPKCGATDISLNTKTGNLRCNYCRLPSFKPKKLKEWKLIFIIFRVK